MPTLSSSRTLANIMDMATTPFTDLAAASILSIFIPPISSAKTRPTIMAMAKTPIKTINFFITTSESFFIHLKGDLHRYVERSLRVTQPEGLLQEAGEFQF